MDASSPRGTQAFLASSGRLPELARTVAARAASLSRKYPARLAAVVAAALAGIIAGRRRRSR
jgi:hypothetical protein